MKLRCPRCHRKLSVSDQFAGKAIRCPACNRAFLVPKPQASLTGPEVDAGLDLEGLATMESQSGELGRRELAQAEAAVSSHEKERKSIRICPKCQKETQIDDPYAEVLCSHCWQPIPTLVKAGGPSAEARLAAVSRAKAATTGPAAFYPHLVCCVTYPLPAAGSVLGAAFIAIAAAVVPVAIITGGVKLMAQSAVGTTGGVQAGDLSSATLVLMVVFAVEVFVFLAIALHAFLDVVRTTVIQQDKPPSLSWSPSQWGRSLFAYLLLIVYYAVMTYLVASLIVEGDVIKLLLKGHFRELLASGGTDLLVGLVVISCVIPMSLIGIAVGSATQGLNPINVATSIGRTHVHYVFLVLLLSVYGAMFGAAFATVLFDWFLPRFDVMLKSTSQGELMQVAMAMLVWGLVMGVFFYGAYVLARLHGLFARAFREKLAFIS